MSEEKKPTNEQVVVQDLVNQLQEKESIIINLRVTIAQLKVEIAEAQEKKSTEDKAKDKTN